MTSGRSFLTSAFCLLPSALIDLILSPQLLHRGRQHRLELLSFGMEGPYILDEHSGSDEKPKP